MIKDFEIRVAQKEDMPRVLELIKELAAHENSIEEVKIEVKDLEKEGFEHCNFTCFVAEANGKIEGMALVYFKFSSRKGRVGYLEDLVVNESFRGYGLGKALFHRVIEFGKENGVKNMEWVVSKSNRNAIKFYKNSGADIKTNRYTVYMDEIMLRNNSRK